MSDDLIVKIVVALLASVWIGDLVKGWYQRKKVNASANKEEADGAQIIVESAKSLLAPLNKTIKELRTEVDSLREQVRLGTAETVRLNTQVHNLTMQLEECSAENNRVTVENRRLRKLIAGESR